MAGSEVVGWITIKDAYRLRKEQDYRSVMVSKVQIPRKQFSN